MDRNTSLTWKTNPSILPEPATFKEVTKKEIRNGG
jgi:hypothetical protein